MCFLPQGFEDWPAHQSMSTTHRAWRVFKCTTLIRYLATPCRKKGQSGQSLLFVTIFDISSRGLYLLFSAQLGTGIIHDNPSSFRSIGYFSEIGPPWGLRRWTHGKPLEPKLLHRRKSRSQNSDNMDRWKAEQGRGREKRKIRRRERVRRKKMQMREKVGKSRNIVFFQWFGAPEGRKVGSLKRRVRSQLARWEMKNCTPLWREAHLQVKMYKHLGLGALLEVGMSKKCTPLWREAHFQVKMYKTHHVRKLRCWKSARRGGAKHISKSKCAKHTMYGPFLEVQMSKKLWREAHFEVKMLKTPGVRTNFGGPDVASRGRRKGFCTLSKVSKNLRVLKHFQLQPPLHHSTLQYITLHYNYNYNFTTFYYTTLHYTTLHSITLHYTTLHDTTLHYTTLHYTTFHYTSLYYTTLHSTTLQLQLHNYTPLHSTTLNYTPLH